MKKASFLLCAFIGTTLSAQNIPAYIPSNGLVAWYPFDSIPVDESGNGHNATYWGTGVVSDTDRFGVPNKACHFDGQTGSYIRIAADSFPTNDRTVSMWFNVPDVSNRPMLLGYGGSGCVGYGNSFLTGLNVGGAASYQTQAHYYSNSLDYPYGSDPINTWINWIVVINGPSISFYIDGVLVPDTGIFTYPTVVTNSDLVFGVMPWCNGIAPYTDQNGGYLLGNLDDIAIWNRALSPNEISNVYNGTTTAITSNGEENNTGIFFNSAASELNFNTQNNENVYHYEIYDCNGRVVKTGNISKGNSVISMREFASGLYTVVIPEVGQTLKFIKNE